MRKLRFLMPIGFLLIAATFGVMVMLLWNWLIPSIFGLAVINFWQATGLWILARILFGGFGFGRNRMTGGRMEMKRHNAIHEKWMKMTPEQRREFINKRRQFGFGRPFGRGHFDMDECQEQNKEDE